MPSHPEDRPASAGGDSAALAEVAGAVQAATLQTERTAIDLRAQLDEIATLSRSISQLSRQTNLLALNATLEAARAGEAGRGFRVVSQEVKGLAQRAAVAAAEIDTRLRGAIRAASANEAAIADLIRAVGQGVALVGQIAGATPRPEPTR